MSHDSAENYAALIGDGDGHRLEGDTFVTPGGIRERLPPELIADIELLMDNLPLCANPGCGQRLRAANPLHAYCSVSCSLDAKYQVAYEKAQKPCGTLWAHLGRLQDGEVPPFGDCTCSLCTKAREAEQDSGAGRPPLSVADAVERAKGLDPIEAVEMLRELYRALGGAIESATCGAVLEVLRATDTARLGRPRVLSKEQRAAMAKGLRGWA